MIQVIKIGGGILEDAGKREAFLQEFAAVEGPKVLVHGGGRLATTMADRLGVEQQMIDGRRVTDKETLDIVTMVYGGLVNKQLVASLQTWGINALGLTGADGAWMKAVKRPIKNGIDYGYVGDVTQVNGLFLQMLIDNDYVPVIAPLTFSVDGCLLNTNADTIASETAIAMAEAMRREGEEVRGNVQLTFCFEKAGVLRDAEDESSVIECINRESYKQLLADGIVSGGMIPKIDNAFAAIEHGVQSVRITHATNLQGGTIIQEK